MRMNNLLSEGTNANKCLKIEEKNIQETNNSNTVITEPGHV